MTGGQKFLGILALCGVAGAGFAYSAQPQSDPPGGLAVARSSAFGPAEAGAATPSLEGKWVIGSDSSAGYRVREKLASNPVATEAVGRSTAVSGGLTVETVGQNYSVSKIEILVDVSKLVSDDPRRDDALRTRALETDRFPTATFEAEGPIPLTALMTGGQTESFTLQGKLTIREVTRHVSIPVQARFLDNRAEVFGSITFPMSEFGITPPNIENVITVEPTAAMEFHLRLSKAA